MPRWWVANAQQAARDVIEAQRTGTAAENTGAGSSGYSTADDIASALPRQYALRLELLYVASGLSLPRLLNCTALVYREERLQAAWVPLTLDAGTQAWLKAAAPAWWRGLLVPPLQWIGFNGPDIDALLGTGRMHVLSAAHVAAILGPHVAHASALPPSTAAEGGPAPPSGGGSSPPLRVLDIGAGSGEVTSNLKAGLELALAGNAGTSAAPPEVHITATDSSAACVRSLKAKGFHGQHCSSVDEGQDAFAQAGQFQVVACLNVLDRCADPRALLRDAVRLLAPGGTLVFALVLPWDDFVEEGGVQRKPDAPLPMNGYRCGDGPGMEVCLGGFLRNVLGVLPGSTEGGSIIPEGSLTLLSVSRVPYLAEGDLFAQVYWLPNAIVVCRKLGQSGEGGAANV